MKAATTVHAVNLLMGMSFSWIDVWKRSVSGRLAATCRKRAPRCLKDQTASLGDAKSGGTTVTGNQQRKSGQRTNCPLWVNHLCERGYRACQAADPWQIAAGVQGYRDEKGSYIEISERSEKSGKLTFCDTGGNLNQSPSAASRSSRRGSDTPSRLLRRAVARAVAAGSSGGVRCECGSSRGLR